MSTMKPLELITYAVWLREHVAQGGVITHAYDYPYANNADTMFSATKNFRTGGECGASAVHILPLPGVWHLGGDLGHNVIFPLDGGTCRFVPVYDDPVFDHIPGVAEVREREERKSREFWARIRAREEAQEARARYSDVPRRSRNW